MQINSNNLILRKAEEEKNNDERKNKTHKLTYFEIMIHCSIHR